MCIGRLGTATTMGDTFQLPDEGGTWLLIHEETLLTMLRMVSEGQSPDLVYAEHYANIDHEYPV